MQCPLLAGGSGNSTPGGNAGGGSSAGGGGEAPKDDGSSQPSPAPKYAPSEDGSPPEAEPAPSPGNFRTFIFEYRPT